MNYKQAALVLLLPILSACPEIEGNDDQLNLIPAVLTAQPSEGPVGAPIEVALSATIALNSRSELTEVALSDLGIGVCFAEGHNLDESGSVIKQQGFCDIEDTSLPAKYQMLDDTSYFKELGDVVIRYGEELTFEHEFTFTVSESEDLTLVPYLFYVRNGTSNPEAVSGPSVEVAFTQP